MGFAESFLAARDNATARRWQQDDRNNDSALRRLMGEAYNAPPDQQQRYLGEIASRGGNAAQLEGVYGQRQERNRETLAQRARTWLGLTPEMRAQAWDSGMNREIAAMGPEFSALATMPYDDATFMPVIQQLAASAGGGVGESARATGFNELARDLTPEERNAALRVELGLDPRAAPPGYSWVEEYDPATGRTTKRLQQTRGWDPGAPAVGSGPGVRPQSPADPTARGTVLDPASAPGSARAKLMGAGSGNSLQPGGLSKLVQVAPPVQSILSELSATYGVPPSSLHRTPEVNERVGGLPNSQHLVGTAGDFPVPAAMRDQFMRDARGRGLEAIDEGDHVHLELPPDQIKRPATGAPNSLPPAAVAPYAGRGGYAVPGSAPGTETLGGPDAYSGASYGADPYGGGRIITGPSNAEAEAQKEREAAAAARGSIYGQRQAGPNFDDETSLRKEYESAVKESRDVIAAYERVEGAARNPSAAGDLSLIFAYMKMLDPGSVVREGEFANAQNAAGIPDRIWNLYNRALEGERLNPAQRADFLAQAGKLRDQAQARWDGARERYRGMAPDYNMDPDRIAPNSANRAPTPGAVEDGYRFTGGDPADPNNWEAL